MERFTALSYAPTEARRLLRYRFAKNLFPARAVYASPDGVRYPDEAVLGLLADLTVKHNAEVAAAERAYTSIEADNPGAPTFDELLTEGWIRVVRGGVRGDNDVTLLVRHDGPFSKALLALQHYLYGVRYHVDHRARHAKRLPGLVELLLKRPDKVRTILCSSPAWVAARLWERLCERGEGDEEGLVRWEAWWKLLGHPSFVPSTELTPGHSKAFIASALAVLDQPGVLRTWSELVDRRALQRAFVQGTTGAPMPLDRDTLPKALIDRYGWLKPGAVSEGRDEIELVQAPPAFCALLFEEIEATEFGKAPLPLASSLLAIAVERPEMLAVLEWRVAAHPALFADLCLFPQIAPLACLWISNSPHYPSGHDRELTTQHDDVLKLVAFEDALAVTDHHLRTGALSPIEAAPLPRLMRARAHSLRARPASVDADLLQATYDMFARQSRDTLEATVGTLAAGTINAWSDRASLAAALDLIAVGLLQDTVKRKPVVDAYSKTIRDRAARFFAPYVDQRAAASLVVVALRGKMGSRKSFFYAVDIPEIIERETARGINRYIAIDDACRALRAHIRILSRAIAGWVGKIPAELVQALVTNVEDAQFEDDSDEQADDAGVTQPPKAVDGFSALFEATASGDAEAPIADDIARAFDRLHVQQRGPLLQAVLQSREPSFLARLMTQAPTSLTDPIAARIRELSQPGAAGAIFSLTEAQLRVEQLLNAGDTVGAEHFIEEELRAKTWGKVPARDVVRLRQILRMHYMKGNIELLRKFDVPDGMEHRAGQDVVDFFKGLAWMESPDPSMDFAASLFERLRNQGRDVPGYTVNYFAARIRSLLGNDGFGYIPAKSGDAAREVLAEARQVSSTSRSWNLEDRDTFDLNLSVLLVATGSCDEALRRLTGIRSRTLDATVTAYTAVAQSRTGRSAAAVTTITAAIARLGADQLLVAARDHVDRGEPYEGRVVTTVNGEAVGAALLSHFFFMAPHERASAMFGGDSPERKRAIEEVRASVGALQDVTFALKSGAARPIEDDITSLCFKLLVGRESLMGWTWHEQSRGGVTAAGNSGERDLVLKGRETTYAVLEAVVIDRPTHSKWSSGELLNHYFKLFAYSTTRLFFHVVYSYVAQPETVLDKMRDIARDNAPSGFAYVGQTSLEQIGSQPPGFMAEYRHTMGNAFVVFLVADLRQQAQRDSAAAARAANPRPKSPGPKKAESTRTSPKPSQ